MFSSPAGWLAGCSRIFSTAHPHAIHWKKDAVIFSTEMSFHVLCPSQTGHFPFTDICIFFSCSRIRFENLIIL